MTRTAVDDPDFTLLVGDVRAALATLEDGSVDCVVTSPPYWGLRDYGAPGQLGLEPTPDLYVTDMVAVFREVRRVLAGHGTLWLNLGDSYASSPPGNVRGVGETSGLAGAKSEKYRETLMAGHATKRNTVVGGLKPKDLVGIPWRVAFALQTDGWYLRSDIIWAKPNPMPESVTDRPTKSHEYVFLLSKRPSYWFDQEAVREPHRWQDEELLRTNAQARQGARIAARRAAGDQSVVRTQPEIGREKGRGKNGNHESELSASPAGRNVRSVWEIATQPYPEAHFATYPEKLVERCLLAGCPEWVCGTCGRPRERIVEQVRDPDALKDHAAYRPRWDTAYDGKGAGPHGRTASAMFADTLSKRRVDLGWSDCGHNNYRPGRVLDPFLGSGTTAHVARRHGRHCVGIELNPKYAELAAKRLQQLSLLAEGATL